MFLFGLAIFGLALVVPLYFQQARGWSALHAGLLAVPQSIGMAAGLIAGGRLTDTIGPRRIVLAGVLLSAAGLAAFATVDDRTSPLFLALAGLVTGIGLGATRCRPPPPPTVRCAPPMYHKATSTVRIFQQLGGSFGAAILAVPLQNQLTHEAMTAGGQLTAAATAPGRRNRYRCAPAYACAWGRRGRAAPRASPAGDGTPSTWGCCVMTPPAL